MPAISGSELSSVDQLQNVDDVTAKTEDCLSSISSTPTCSLLDEMFADRYTTRNHSYAKISEGFDPVICLYPFHSRPTSFEKNKRHWDNGRWAKREPQNDWRHESQADVHRPRGYKRQRPSWSHQ